MRVKESELSDLRDIMRGQVDGVFSPKVITFLCCAKLGSFSSAAKLLHLSRPAVIKQINELEKALGVRLFERDSHGVVLTDAGKVFCGESSRILAQFNKAVGLARAIEPAESGMIRVGVSQMTPGWQIEKFLPELQKDLPDIHFSFVPFINGEENARLILASLGEEVDIVVGARVGDPVALARYNCDGVILRNEPITVGIPAGHRLSGRRSVSLGDLNGERVYCIHQGWNRYFDKARADIVAHCPDARIVDFDVYEADVFNNCKQELALILTTDAWEEGHPMIASTPIEWGNCVALGALFSPAPSSTVRRFVDYAQEYVEGRI